MLVIQWQAMNLPHNWCKMAESNGIPRKCHMKIAYRFHWYWSVTHILRCQLPFHAKQKQKRRMTVWMTMRARQQKPHNTNCKNTHAKWLSCIFFRPKKNWNFFPIETHTKKSENLSLMPIWLHCFAKVVWTAFVRMTHWKNVVMKLGDRKPH